MSSGRKASPARSQGGPTPRRQAQKAHRSRSMGSPARSNASGRLSTLIQEYRERDMGSFVLSPMTRKSLLPDNTDIGEPRRSWWQRLDENSRDYMDVVESDQIVEENNIMEELDIEVLSQEKRNYTLDLPESSDGESINSIVLPQRKLFTQKEQKTQKFGLVNNNRATLSKINKTNATKDVDVPQKELFHNTSRSRPVFPAALLTSPNKTTGDKTLVADPKPQVRNIFGNRQGVKRKNMFANYNFIDSEGDVSDIQPKVFGFQRKDGTRISLRETSPSSNTTDIEMDDWRQLPSSTMVENQLEAMMDGQSPKRGRLSKLTEDKESDVGSYATGNKTAQSNKSASSKNRSKTEDKENAPELNKSLNKSMKDNEQDKSIKDNDQMNKQTEDQDKTLTQDDVNVKQNKTNEIANDLEVQNKQSKSINKKNLSLSKNKTKLMDTDKNKSQEVNEEVKESHNQTVLNCEEKDISQEVQNERQNILNESNKENNENESSIDKHNQESNQEPEDDQQAESDQEDENVQNESNEDNDNGKIVEDSAQEIEKENESSQGEIEEQNDSVAESNQEDENEKSQDEIQEQNDSAAIQNESDKDRNDAVETNQAKDDLQVEVEREMHNDDENEQKESGSEKQNQSLNIHNENQKEKVEKEAKVAESNQEMKNKDQNESHVQNEDLEENRKEIQVAESDQEVENDEEMNEEEPNESNLLNKSQEENNVVEVPQSNQESENEQIENDDQNENNIQEDNNVEEIPQSDQESENEEVESEDQNESNIQNKSQEESEVAESEQEDQQVESDQEEDQQVESEQEEDQQVESDQEIETDQNESNVENNETNNSQAECDQDTNEGSDQIDNDVQMESDQENEQAIESEEENDEQVESDQDDDQIDNDEPMESDQENEEQVESEQEIDQRESDHQADNKESDQEDQNTEEIDGTPNVSHDTTGRNRHKNQSPEIVLHNTPNHMDSFVKGRNTTAKKSKSMMKNMTLRPSLLPARESLPPNRDSLNFSDGTKNSSAEGSGWDSHRTTRKTLRQTFGKEFTPRKSLRTLVMEKSAKRQTLATHASDITTKFPQANSTEMAEVSCHGFEANESNHDVSLRTRQTTLEMYLEKVKQRNMENRLKIEEKVRNSLKAPTRDLDNPFKVPAKPMFARRAITKQNKSKANRVRSTIPLETLPEEFIEDMKYKPPKRFQPSDASWITKRLYKYLETKLEAKYQYKKRVRAEKLVESLYYFTKELKRRDAASQDSVDVLKHELARLDIVQTHFDFYEFFYEFMPREVIVKVVPDVANMIPMPRRGVFSDIIHGNTVQ